MNALLNVVPFFIAARVSIDSSWCCGPVYTFHVQVNSTELPEKDSYMSIRLNVASKLVCQPKEYHVFSCHFRDSKADSYATDNLDPEVPAVPISQVSRQKAYEINQDQFEIKFNERGLDSLVVNENIQPRELDMIRAIVEQLNIGVLVNVYDHTYELVENFTQGECVTIFTVQRGTVAHPFHTNRGYVLETVFGLEEGLLVQIRKIRNLNMCTHKVPYLFGSSETMSHANDMVSTVISSESQIVITSNEFISGTTNVITNVVMKKGSGEIMTTLYENISLRLESITPAVSEAPEVKDPEPASMFVGRWRMDSSMEDMLKI
ncbi:PREDICTED: uncharacterized protein LOC108550546 [Eufriesea mexicana]|uniref:uncharacterized protein LOC108550546 n=1 Tax=Eufriesea mexicana TaxID=516756 RepID=UPI00083C4D0A|nr:PREDICTED: uncharacterized protein LOC108550546 [Eufriesea mexicana]XP_017759791.1 PREDICTED: uncharacterized protein LOC108550546 [Eufriesea mexicana]